MSAATDSVFRALADPTRRAIFERLTKREHSVKALTSRFHVSQPAVSQHLAHLRTAGLVAERREGRVVYYRVAPRGLHPLVTWMQHHEAFWQDRLSHLEAPRRDAMTRSIEVDYDLPHAPQKVWRALTEPALLGAWLMENDLEAVVGHRFQFRAKPVGGWDGIVYCEVLDVAAPRLLRYRWQGGKDEGKGPGSHLDTVVTWTLSPTPAGTRLHLSHTGFLDKDAFAYENMGKGWRGHLAERLAAALTS